MLQNLCNSHKNEWNFHFCDIFLKPSKLVNEIYLLKIFYFLGGKIDKNMHKNGLFGSVEGEKWVNFIYKGQK